MAQMQSAAPARKVWVGTMVGSGTAVLLWLIGSIAKVDIPPGMAATISTLMTSIVSYIVPPAPSDGIVQN
jgi:hypothetical protein